MVKMGKYDDFLRYLDVSKRGFFFLHHSTRSPRAPFDYSRNDFRSSNCTAFFSVSSEGRTLLSEDAAGSQRCVGIALGRGMRSPRLRVASHRTAELLPESRSAW